MAHGPLAANDGQLFRAPAKGYFGRIFVNIVLAVDANGKSRNRTEPHAVIAIKHPRPEDIHNVPVGVE